LFAPILLLIVFWPDRTTDTEPPLGYIVANR